jgi:hypothetical protein
MAARITRAQATAALEEQLQAPPPAALVAGLAPRELVALADTIQAARRAQARELAVATEHALDIVPRVLRGAVKRVVGVR